MKKFFNKKSLSVLLVIALVGGIFVGTAVVQATKSSAKTPEDVAKEALLAKRSEVLRNNLKMNTEASEKEVVRAIVTLKAKSVADTNNVSDYNSELKSKEEKIIGKQESIIKKVEKITGNEVINQTAYLVNSFSIDATRAQMKKIAMVEGVDTVYEASTYTTTMATAVDEGNVRNVWESKEYGYTGEGVVVAVLDTGVNYEHQDMKLDEGVKKKFTKEEWLEKIELLGYGKYNTEKVPFGYDYSENKDECLSINKNHGYHVAGIIASNGEIVGAAKNAQIIGMKVFSDKGQGANTDDIVKAIEDSVKLGADIINMSLGYDKAVISDEDFSQKAVANATKDGVICCIAAGNAGTSASMTGVNTNEINMIDTTTVGTPAVAKSALTVASADNIAKATMSEMVAKLGDTEETFEYYDFVGRGFDVKDLDMVDVGIGVDGDRNNIFESHKVKGKLAIVMRGVSTFNDKMYRLSKAGAKAIVLVDYTDVISTNIGCNDWYGVPVIVVGKSTGDKLLLAKDAGKKFSTVSTKLVEELIDVRMSSFSSWGTTNEIDIKPEIAAPGGNITAPTTGTDTYETLSGTSMATPFVAGSEALMLNAIRDKGLNLEGEVLVDFMKNNMMNTADMITDPDTKLPYSVRYQGAGLIDVYGAVDNDVIATVNEEAKVELREVQNGQTFQINFTNYGKEDAKYTLEKTRLYADYTKNNFKTGVYEYGISPVEGAFITYDATTVEVKAGGTATVNATVTIPATYKNNKYVEGFIKISGEGVQSLGLPVLGFNGEWDNETIIDAPIYESENAYFNGVNNAYGIASSTGLVGMTDGDLDDYLGREIVDMNSTDKKVTTAGAENLLSVADKSRIGRAAVTTGLVEKDVPDKKGAINVRVGDTAELAIINAGDYGMYKLSSKEDTGCKIYADGALAPYIIIYDKNMNFVTGTAVQPSIGGDRPFEFSIKANKKYFVQVMPTQAEVGLSTVTFAKTAYFANEDLALYETVKKPTKINYLKVGRTTTVANNGENEHSFVFECKKDGIYKFTVNSDTFVQYAMYEFSKNRADKLTYVETVAEGTEYGKAVIEVALKAKSKYALDLLSDANYIQGKNFASVSVAKGKAEEVKALGTVFDGNKNAFSPNGDDVRDSILPYITQLRNAGEISVKVLDADKNVVRTLAKCIDTNKITLADMAAGYAADILANYAENDYVKWDGTLYNKKTKKFEVAPDGQYYIQLESKLSKNSLPQVVTMPVKVDTVAPRLDNYALVEKGDDTVLTFSASDDKSLSPYYYAYIQQSGKAGMQPMEGAIGKIYAATDKNAAGEYEFNLGNLNNANVFLMLEDAAGNTSVDVVAVNEANKMTEAEYMEDILGEMLVDTEMELRYPTTAVPTVDLVGDASMKSLKNYNLQNASLVLLNENVGDKLSFQVKVTDADSPAGHLSVQYMSTDTGEFGIAKNNGDGTFTINTSMAGRISSLAVFVSDVDGNMNYRQVLFYHASKEEDFKLDCTELDFSMTANLETTYITEDMLNADGTFTVRGILGAYPDAFSINGDTVEINKDDNSFEYDVKVTGGKTRINILVSKDGIENETSAELYYNKMEVTFVDSIKEDENGVITTNNSTFNFAGTISSLINVGSMNVNGENVFVCGESITASFDKPIIREFNFPVELEEGENSIVFEIYDLSGQKTVKELIVNYVK